MVSLSAGVAGLFLPVPALAVSPDIVISQVYGGGGNTSATYTNDFVELYNRGATAVDVTGWSVQYASAAGSTWQITPLTGLIQPGGYYLVQEAQGAGGTTPLPAPDASDTIAMSATSGKVALVTNQTPLTCCDRLRFRRRSARLRRLRRRRRRSRAAAAPMLSNITAALRDDAGDADTDNNSTDFSAGAPNPRNSVALPETADLAVTKNDAPDPVTAGQNLVYTVTVANNGPDDAQTVTLTDTLPTGTTFVSAVYPGGWMVTTPPVGSGGTVTATRPTLAVGDATFTITVNVGTGRRPARSPTRQP